MTVLVTGVGGPAGIAVAQALTEAGETVIGVDADEWAAGFGLVDAHAVVPYASDPSYLPILVDLAARYGVDSLISTVAEELVALKVAEFRLAHAGVATWLPTVEAVNRCNDKLSFAAALAAADVAHPVTGTGAHMFRADEGPWVVKPASGRGSRDVTYPTTLGGIAFDLAALGGNGIAQTRLSGREFTADTLTDREGVTLTVVARWRVTTKAGISTMGETFVNDSVTEQATAALAAVDLVGPGCVQGFVNDDGIATVMEINPRFSGGLPLSLASGADLVGQYLNGIRGLPVDQNALTYQPGVRMSRYFSAVYSIDGAPWAPATPTGGRLVQTDAR